MVKDLIVDETFDDLKPVGDNLTSQFHVINDEFGVYANCSTKNKISILRELFDRCCLDKVELGLSLKVLLV